MSDQTLKNKKIKTWNSSSIPIAAFKKTYSSVFMQFFYKFDILGSMSPIVAF